MTCTVKTLAQLKKAEKLVRLSMRRNGPRSYNRGIGVLLRAFKEADELSRNELIDFTGWSRHNLKNVVKKGEKKGLFALQDTEGAGYKVTITAAGKDVLEKRCAAQKKAADQVLSVLTEEEIAQLDAITEKIIVGIKEDGKVSAYGKGHKFHKGHKGHCPHAESK